ncbi:MAG: AAA family ATPase, partial [Pseudomonadales bacterium]
MTGINRGALFGKLSPIAYKAIDGATTFCKLRGNPHVEFVHWLHQILNNQDSDIHRIVEAFEIDVSKLVTDVTARLDALPRGATSISNFSPHVEEAVERGWVAATLMFGESKVRTGHLVVGLLQTNGLSRLLSNISPEFDKIKLDRLVEDFAGVCSGSPEEAGGAQDGSSLSGGAAPGEVSGAMATPGSSDDALNSYTVDWTERARNSEMDPIVGRDEEIRQIVDILMRRRQNNPILTGEAGVGKTAVIEGFAQRIASGDVPPAMQNVTLRELDVARLQAGASMKGEFENRLKQVIEEVQGSEKPVILFIDEAHTLIGAGGAAGTGDAANLLKPALARGTLRTIAATTWAEYKKHIEKDPALTRRFQVVQIDEPSEDKAILMMRGMASTMEKHHQVQVLDEAIEASVRLSHRYIPARQLPDKSTSLLDTACARVAISQHATPAALEDAVRTIESLDTELQIIGREAAVGVDVGERQDRAETQLLAAKERRSSLEERWKEERELVDQLLELRAQLRADQLPIDGDDAVADDDAEPGLSDPERQELLQQLIALQDQLATLQGESPLILPSVDAQAVASVV